MEHTQTQTKKAELINNIIWHWIKELDTTKTINEITLEELTSLRDTLLIFMED